MGKPRLPDVLEQKIVRHYEKNKSVFRVAKRFGVGSSTVHRVLKRHGIECDGLKLYRKQITKLPDGPTLKAQYESGLSAGDIGRNYGACRSSVLEALTKAGIPKRRRGNTEREYTRAEIDGMVSLYKELRSQTAVAETFGTSQAKVSRILRNEGIYDGQRPSGARHGLWKGGRSITSSGYVQVKVQPDDPLFCMAARSGHVLEHRLVMAKHLGRPLSENETVHHKNGDRTDNQPDNLEMRQGKHGKHQRWCCADCGSFNLKCVELE